VFGDGPGTWWGLTEAGLLAAGFVDEAAQVAYLNEVYGTSFPDLNSLKTFTLAQLDEFYDLNRNGFVCAFELRGTRRYLNDPYVNLTAFAVTDDRIGK